MVDHPIVQDEVFLDIGDGPEGFKIYTDDNRGVVDWSPTFPPVYVDISINGMSATVGPFTLASIYKQLKEKFNG